MSGLEPIVVDDDEEDRMDEFDEGKRLPGPSNEQAQEHSKTNGHQISMRRSSMLQVVLTRLEDEFDPHQSPSRAS